MLDTQVRVFEEKDTVGGACKTEYPFTRVPGLGTSTGTPSVQVILHYMCHLSQCVTFRGAEPRAFSSSSLCLQAHICWE